MTQHQGGARVAQTNTPYATPRKLRKSRPSRFAANDLEKQLGIPTRLISKRQVRKIVTVSGRGARGRFPSRKGKLIEFESLGEEDTLRVYEVASIVRKLITQPCVLEFEAGNRYRRYTPDCLATINGIDYFVEVKAAGFQKNKRVVAHLRDVIQYMRREQLPFILIVATDVRAEGLQDELKHLLNKRARPGRFDSDIDPTLWDPLNGEYADPGIVDRWHRAQKECNGIILRAMRRDPNSLLGAA